MKILLVLPAAERVRVTRSSSRVPSRGMLRFSILPLTTVAALTPSRHEVSIVDENVEALDLDRAADVVGITFMTALAPRAYEIADAFRARGTKVVAGGFHPTFCPEEARTHFDAVVVGEAEGVWPRVLEDIEAGAPLGIYRSERPCDPASIPAPRRELTSRTARHYVTTNAVQTGRGCRHSCRYCSITAFHGATHRSRPLEAVLSEIRSVPRDFLFVDDNLLADPDYARRLFREMAPMRKRWVGQCSIQIGDDPEMLRLAREAGSVGLFLGIETLSDANLAAVEKEFNDPGGYRRRIAEIRRHGIGVIAGIVVGMDCDVPETFERTLRFLRRSRIDAIQVNVLTPLPGTPLFEDYSQKGRILDRDWSHYDFRHTVIWPARMTPGQLQEGADWLYSSFYRLDRILFRFARSTFDLGWTQAWLGLRLGLTYRYDNRREGIVGRNPARSAPSEAESGLSARPRPSSLERREPLLD